MKESGNDILLTWAGCTRPLSEVILVDVMPNPGFLLDDIGESYWSASFQDITICSSNLTSSFVRKTT